MTLLWLKVVRMALELVKCIAPGKTLFPMMSDRDLLLVFAVRGPQTVVGSVAASNSEGVLERLLTLGHFLSPLKP